jgi:hypothetical protein
MFVPSIYSEGIFHIMKYYALSQKESEGARLTELRADRQVTLSMALPCWASAVEDRDGPP